MNAVNVLPIWHMITATIVCQITGISIEAKIKFAVEDHLRSCHVQLNDLAQYAHNQGNNSYHILHKTERNRHGNSTVYITIYIYDGHSSSLHETDLSFPVNDDIALRQGFYLRP